jgi:hypothetical protein
MEFQNKIIDTINAMLSVVINIFLVCFSSLGGYLFLFNSIYIILYYTKIIIPSIVGIYDSLFKKITYIYYSNQTQSLVNKEKEIEEALYEYPKINTKSKNLLNLYFWDIIKVNYLFDSVDHSGANHNIISCKNISPPVDYCIYECKCNNTGIVFRLKVIRLLIKNKYTYIFSFTGMLTYLELMGICLFQQNYFKIDKTDKTDNKVIGVHSGFYNYVIRNLSIIEKVKTYTFVDKFDKTENLITLTEKILNSEKDEIHKVYFIGHSLGGAKAIILNTELKNKVEFESHLITYGTPNVFSENIDNITSNHTLIENDTDIVCKLGGYFSLIPPYSYVRHTENIKQIYNKTKSSYINILGAFINHITYQDSLEYFYLNNL